MNTYVFIDKEGNEKVGDHQWAVGFMLGYLFGATHAGLDLDNGGTKQRHPARDYPVLSPQWKQAMNDLVCSVRRNDIATARFFQSFFHEALLDCDINWNIWYIEYAKVCGEWFGVEVPFRSGNELIPNRLFVSKPEGSKAN